MEEIRLRDFRQAPQEDGGEAVVLVFFFKILLISFLFNYLFLIEG